jgi:hypothetical protein
LVYQDKIFQRVDDLLVHVQVVILGLVVTLNVRFLINGFIITKLVQLENFFFEVSLHLAFSIPMEEVIHRLVSHIDGDLMLLAQVK